MRDFLSNFPLCDALWGLVLQVAKRSMRPASGVARVPRVVSAGACAFVEATSWPSEFCMKSARPVVIVQAMYSVPCLILHIPIFLQALTLIPIQILMLVQLCPCCQTVGVLSSYAKVGTLDGAREAMGKDEIDALLSFE